MMTQKLAAKMLLVACLGLISACGLVFLPKAKATTILGNPDPMAQACIANYTRVAPHICFNSDITATASRSATFVGSETWDLSATLPSSTTLAVVQINTFMVGNNVLGAAREVTANFCGNGLCSASQYTYRTSVREDVATLNEIRRDVQMAHIKVINSTIKYGATRPNANTTMTLNLVGYYD